jgi:excisionase family DNA binding protein
MFLSGIRIFCVASSGIVSALLRFVFTRPPTDGERSFLIDDAAQLLGVSRRTIYYRIREGRLRTIRTRCGSQRVLVSSIEILLREMRGRAAKTTSTEVAPQVLEAEPLAL